MRLTLFHAVLLGTVLILLASNTLDALIVVVLGGGALLRLGAFCSSQVRSALVVHVVCVARDSQS